MAQKFLTKDGRLIDPDQTGGAHLVDTDEPGAQRLIESVRQLWKRENGTEPWVEDGEPPLGDVGGELSPELLQAESTATAPTKEDGSPLSPQLTTNELPLATGTGAPVAESSDPGKPAIALTPQQQILLDGLGKKIVTALAAVGIVSKEQLAAKSDTELDAIPQIGADSIKTIRAFLSEAESKGEGKNQSEPPQE